MKNILLYCFSLIILSCNEPKKWIFEKEIQLDNTYPIGVTQLDGEIWLSDGNGNRLVQIDDTGKLLQEIKDFERPMHISSINKTILVPEYGRDSIAAIQSNSTRKYINTPKLDAPAGVDQWKNEIAIADFYSHSVLFKKDTTWLTIGKKGSNAGEFNYPTDVQITSDFIYVADAYNHRVQVFSKEGKHLETIGETFNMNASTGIYVTDNELYITDFENDRVMVCNTEGTLLQELKTAIEKPTDILIVNNKLWILNFKKGSISVFAHFV